MKLGINSFKILTVFNYTEISKMSFFPAHYYCTKKKPQRDVIRVDNFLNIQEKTKKSYIEMINIYKEAQAGRRDHVEFIYSALKHMNEFGVNKDLEVYKALIDVFPKGKMIPRNLLQAEFMHYPKDQQCAIDLLEQMEENGVMPDWNMEDQLLNVFGSRGYPVRRYWRMMYWKPKFKNASPWLLPEELPRDPLELAKIAVERITSVDPTTELQVQQTTELENSLEDTWIVSGQSQCQRDLITMLPKVATLYVDGGYRIWLKNMSVTYFTLTTPPFRDFPEEEDIEDIQNLLERKLVPRRSVHEQSDNVILGVASSGTSSPDSMLSWVRFLQASIPEFHRLKVLFRISSRHISESAECILKEESN